MNSAIKLRGELGSELKIQDIITVIENFAPKQLTLSWDNVGLIIGDASREAKKILISLDVHKDVVNYAIANHFDVIISHHPPIFKSINSVNTENSDQNNLLKLIENRIAVYSAHTNLDITSGGVNDLFIKILRLRDVYTLDSITEVELFRIGFLNGQLEEIANIIKKRINAKYLRVLKSNNKIENLKVGVCCGGGASFLSEAIKERCDLMISGDFKYHDFISAYNSGLSIIDVWHYDSEKLILKTIQDLFKEESDLYTEIWNQTDLINVV